MEALCLLVMFHCQVGKGREGFVFQGWCSSMTLGKKEKEKEKVIREILFCFLTELANWRMGKTVKRRKWSTGEQGGPVCVDIFKSNRKCFP